MSLIIDNKIIDTDIITILHLLDQQMFLMNKETLGNIDIKQNNARIKCPFHSNGNERTASCDILLEDKLDTPAGTVHCFGCGYTGNIIKFISNCLHINYRKASEWLISVCNYSLVEDTRNLEIIDINNLCTKSKNDYSVSLDELKQYDYVHPYMFTRKLTDDIIDKFEVGYDPNTDSLTFPVYVDGICKFVCKRSVKYHRFEMPKDIEKPIYGLDYITGNEVIVCESIINALTCYRYGKEAIALFGTGTKSQYDTLNKLGIRSYVLAFDGDDAGRKGCYRFKHNINNSIISEMQLPDGKDINDLSKEEFDDLFNNATLF